MSIAENKKLVVGQRVHCGLHYAGDGIVVAIHGEQNPSTVRQLGGIGVTGGSAYFDIAFDDYLSRKVPESIVLGSIQWKVHDEVATTDEIIDAVERCRKREEETKAKQKADADRREREREEHAKNYPYLTKKSDQPNYSPGRLAAHNIRIELKRYFPGVKFSVTSEYNSVSVKWELGPTESEVKSIISKYKAGHFNGMEDTYEHDPDNTFCDVFGDPNYVSEDRSIPKELVDMLIAKYGELTKQTFTKQWDNDPATGSSVAMTIYRILNRFSLKPGDKIVGLVENDKQAGRIEEMFDLVIERATQPKAVAEPSQVAGEFTIQKHYHTKREQDIWAAVLTSKVERPEFEALRNKAKSMGGWYSPKWGSFPGGFCFNSEAECLAFTN